MRKIFKEKNNGAFTVVFFAMICLLLFSACSGTRQESKEEIDSKVEVKSEPSDDENSEVESKAQSEAQSETQTNEEDEIFSADEAVDEDANLNLFPSAFKYEQSGEGRFKSSDISRFKLLNDDMYEIFDIIHLVGDEFFQKGLIEKGVVPAGGECLRPMAGDIAIKMVTDIDGISIEEAFSIEVGEYILLKANSPRAAMYGLRAIEDYLYTQGSMPYGKLLDYPEVSERALHLDMGRKYFEPEWIKARIRDMSRARLNTLQLHFSEHQGFRIECETYPEVMSEKYITKAEMRDILAEAKAYGVDIIPSFDNPGHLKQALREHPEFWLEDIYGNKNKGSIDINKPEAREFVKNIITEYAELFEDSKYFHIGADEFINFDKFDEYPSLAEFGQNFVADGVTANGLDGYTAYINEIASHTRSLGFVPRIWNDGVYRKNMDSHVKLNDYIEICYWTRWNDNMASTDTLMEKGHKLINVNDMMYYVLTDAKIYATPPDAEHLYNNWHNGYFAGFDYEALQRYDMPNENILGSSYAIWCDHEEMQTQEEIAEGIFYSLRAMAEKSWGGQKKKRREYSEWKELVDKLEK